MAHRCTDFSPNCVAIMAADSNTDQCANITTHANTFASAESKPNAQSYYCSNSCPISAAYPYPELNTDWNTHSPSHICANACTNTGSN